MNEVERFRTAYDYLYESGKVHSITEFAKAIGAARTSVSKAYNGDLKYLKGAIMVKVAAAYSEIFNREWIVYGTGEMLTKPVENEKKDIDQNSVIQFLMEQIKEKDRRYEDVMKKLDQIESAMQKQQRTRYGYGVAADDGGIKINSEI